MSHNPFLGRPVLYTWLALDRHGQTLASVWATSIEDARARIVPILQRRGLLERWQNDGARLERYDPLQS